jgi:hypothetical protein
MLLEFLQVSIPEAEQGLPDAEVEDLGHVSRVVEAKVLLEGLPPAGCP